MFFRTPKEQIKFVCAECSDFAPLEHPIKRLFIKFSTTDLINYLQENPDVCQKILEQSSDKRYGPATFITPTENNYLVGIYNGEYDRVQVFPSVEEAVADYVLLNWKLPRLRPAETERKAKVSLDFFYDENGMVLDKLSKQKG